uniref:Uncharacterized protein n=1 Tax=Amphimedon queenslandica TaxID=400682 RepID=A0A1X7U147_AMPQE
MYCTGSDRLPDINPTRDYFNILQHIATLVCRLTNNVVPWDDIYALMSCQLVALGKCPGVCPIAIGKTLRIIGKTVRFLTRYDLNDTSNNTQLCGRVKCGIEAAIHTESDLFKENENHG